MRGVTQQRVGSGLRRGRCDDWVMSEAPRRMRWGEVPDHVQAAVAELLGSPVVWARSQAGGFSPGSADRVMTADGERAFVKTAWSRLNRESTDIHRLEARKSERLPPGIPAPRFLGAVDHGDWVAVVFEDIEGQHPTTPWTDGELGAVLDALAALAQPVLPDNAVIPPLAEELAALFGGWGRIGDASRLPLEHDLGEWARERLPEFVTASALALADLRGDRLVHMDARADNILIRPDGSVALVDWPWAARGIGWFDALTLLVNVRLYDPQCDVEALIRGHRVFRDMPADAATRVLTALAGFFLEGSMQPDEPGIPTLRRFQRDQAIACLRWLRERASPRFGAGRGVAGTG